MATENSRLQTNVSWPAAPTHSAQSLSANERLRPATGRQIAVELEKLRAVFGYEAGAWATASGLYLDALADMPPDLLSEAVSETIRVAGPDDHFPRPGVLREFVRERLSHRREQARREALGAHDESWPKWLAEIWGPEPQGSAARNQAFIAEEERNKQSRMRLAQVWQLMCDHGLTADQAWRVWSGAKAVPGEPITPGSLEEPLKRVLAALGVTATERKPPRYEDPEELHQARVELGLEQPNSAGEG